MLPAAAPYASWRGLVYRFISLILCRTHVHVTGTGGVAHAYPLQSHTQAVVFIGFFSYCNNISQWGNNVAYRLGPGKLY